jgi:glycosyltransferase involved in cell wall biosynthesis
MDECGVSIVLGSFNRKRFLKKTIKSIRENGVSLPYEIIVVDGGSTDGTLRFLMSQKDVITIVQHNRGTWKGEQVPRRSWGYFMNLGFKTAHGKFICMISDDSLLIPGAISAGIEAYENATQTGRKVGAVAFYWRNWPEQEMYWVGKTLGNKLFVNHGLYVKDALEDVGWLDEELYSFYHADGDVCLKLWQHGYEVIDCPTAFVEHFSHLDRSIRRENVLQQNRDWETYQQRWESIFSEAEKENHEDWIYIGFDDPDKTAGHFPKLDIYKLRARRFLKSLGRDVYKVANKFTS